MTTSITKDPAAELARARSRLEAALHALGDADRAVDEGDPDDATFARALLTRDAARGRVQALEAREAAAVRAVEAAEQQAKASECQRLQGKLDELTREVASRDAALTEACAEFRRRIAGEAAALRQLVAKASDLDRRLGGAPSVMSTRGSYWASVAPGTEFYMATCNPELERAAQVAQAKARTAA